MSSFLSTPVFLAHQRAKYEGLTGLTLSGFLEIAAALFGYDHYRLMEPKLQNIELALNRSDAVIVLNLLGASRRAVGLFPDGAELSNVDALRYVFLVVTQLRALAPGRVYTSDADFLDECVEPYVRERMMRDLDTDSDARLEHEKVGRRCEVAIHEETPEDEVLWTRSDAWRIEPRFLIYPRGPDGGPDYSGSYLLVLIGASYQKLDKAILLNHPEFSPIKAKALWYRGSGMAL